MATPTIPSDNSLSVNPLFKSNSIEKPVTLKFNPAFKVTEDRALNVSYDLTNYQQNTDRYRKFIDEIYPGVNLERQAAQGQSPLSKIGNMFAQGVVGEILAQGVIGGAGSILAIPDVIGATLGKEDADFSNFMTKFADTISNTLEEKSPIFRYNPGKSFDWKDLGWWTSQGVSLFSTIGLLLPALGEAKAASYFSKALRSLSEVAKVKGVAKGINLVSDVFDTERYWQKITHSAIAMRNAENVRESSQAYTSIYNETLDTVKDDTKFQELLNLPIGQEFTSKGNQPDKIEFAKYIAGKAAWKNYTMNAANVFFDMMQLAPLFKGFKIKTTTPSYLLSGKVKAAQKAVTEKAVNVGTKAVSPGFNAYPFIKGGTVLIGEQLSEGAEELINAISQSESNWYGKHLLGTEKDEGKTNRYNAYLHDPSTWEQAFWGFAGGVAFSGATRGLDKIQNIKNDTMNPYSDQARMDEIKNRYIQIANTSKRINDIVNGLNPNSEDGTFKGTDEEIEQQKKVAIDEVRTLSAYKLAFEASKHGNKDLLLDMINHADFKEKYIEFGLADETNFNAIHAKLVQDINDAEYTYKNIYNNIFTSTISKPWLRDVIIGDGIKVKSKLTFLTRERDAARTNASNLKASNPAYSALKEQNKDNDFDNTLDNLISNTAIKHIEKEITTDDHVINRVLKNSVTGLKQELREKHNLIGNKQAVGDFNSIKDIIENEAKAKILDVFISANNSLYEEVTNTNKSIPIIEKDFKETLTNLNNKNLEAFRSKVSADTEVTNKDTKEDIENKINSLKSQIETLNKTKKNPLVDPNDPISKLDDNYLKSYLNILENRLKYLYQEQNKATSREVVLQVTKDKNETLVNSLQSLFNSLKIDTVKVKFSNKPPDTSLINNIQNYINKGSANTWSTINKLINDTEFIKQLISEGSLQSIYDRIKEDLNSIINNAYRIGKSDELIDAILRGIGYQVIDYKKVDKANDVVDLLNQFKSTLTDDGSIKASVDFNAINPLNKDQVDLANKLMTRIVNSGDIPLFNETRPTVTFWFKSIAAQYARITSIEQLIKDIDVLKAAYRIIREAKINPTTGTKYRYNTLKYIENITAEDIINEFALENESYEYSVGNDEYLEKTGGKDSINTYIFNTKFDFIIDDNGNLVISDKDKDRFDTLLNGVEKDTPVTVQVNTNFLSRKDQKQYANNSDFIPLIVTVNNKGKSIEIASINTMATDHYGVEYDFKKKDWTNVILDDINESNTKAQRITDLVPQLQNWYNLNRINADVEKINEAYEQLLEVDSFGIINEMLGNLNPRTDKGQIALYHISKVIFYGENTDGNSEVASNRFNIINNIQNWKSKLYRDYQGNKKIRNTIGTDATKTINTKVTYVTSGTILTTKGKKFNNLSIVDKPKNIKLFRLADKRTLVNTRNTNETISKPRGQYSNSLFVGVPTPRSTNETKYIPVPVKPNTLNGSLLSSEKDDVFLDAVVSLIEKIGTLRVARRNNKSSFLATEINNLEKQLAEVVKVDYEDNGNINAVISNNKDIRFYSGERYIVYNYYDSKFEDERKTQDGIAKKDISREEFKKELGKLNRQVDYKSLGKTEYIDILGNKHSSYEDYLISTNTIVTDIAQVVDSKGNKISNFVPKTGVVGGTPLAINIDTSMLSISRNASNNFFQFQNQFQLDKKYDFIFELFNKLLTDGENKIKFNGIVAERKKQDGREAFAWYDPATTSISVSKKWIEDQYNVNKENATLSIVHEILHALKGTRTVEEQKILDDKLNEFKTSILATDEYKTLKDKENKTDIDNKIVTILDMKGKNIDEILTYGLTDKDFAKFLDSIKGEVEGVEKTFWTKLLDIIKQLAASFGIKGSKLDELGVLFDKFITGQEIEYLEAKRAEDVKDLNKDKFDELEEEFGGNGEISYASFVSSEYLSPKFSSFASSINQEVTGSPFSEPEEKHVLNILSNYAINILDKKYKGQKLKDFSSDAVRLDILKALTNDVQARKRNNTVSSDQLVVLSKLANLLHKGDEKFWKLFRIHLSNLYGYTINDLEEYREDIEYIEKAWDQTDIYVKHPMNTANDRTKNLVNTTFEIDLNSVELFPDGNRVYKTNTNTPTGFANTLSWSRYADKLYDLMSGSLTEEDMLDALLKYANVVDSIFAKSLYSVYDKLKSDPEQLSAWYTTFDKMKIDSYRTLNRTISTQDEGDLTELSITLGNKKGSAYILANRWTNVIVSRAESDYYDEQWNKNYNDLYIQVHNSTDNFTKLNKSSATFLSKLFEHIGIDVNYDALLGEFAKGNTYFKENIIDPIEYLKSSPSSKEKTGYIDILQKNKNSTRNEYGNLYRLATRLEYYKDDISNHSELNVKGNLVYDLRNPNFIINFFKKLKADDSTIIEFLTPYTKVPSNQHSFLLWGDHIIGNKAVRLGSGIFNFNIVNGIKQIDQNNSLNKKNIDRLKFFGYSGTKNLSEGNTSEYHELNKHDWEYEMFTYYIAKGQYEDEVKVTAILPLLNPSDRKNTLLFETPIINITTEDWTALTVEPNTDVAKESHIFKRLYNIMYDEIIAADVAKKLLFELDDNGRVIYEDGKAKVKQDILDNKIPSQINYHYKLDDNGNKHYLEFENVNGKLVLDTKNSGNIFGFNTMTVLDQNVQITYNDLASTNMSFIEHLLNSPDKDIALNSKVNDTQTYKDKLILFIHRFIQQQYEYAYNNLKKYESSILRTYLKNENANKEEMSYITKDKHFALWVTEFALNTYIFNVEQTRLFYGNLADYKSNSDFNKRGGEVLANGISTTLRGVFHGATISDVKLKSKIYRNIAETLYKIKTGDKLTDSLFNKFNKVYSDNQLKENSMKFSSVEKKIYNTISPYLTNDSANAVSLITLDEFIKRIGGFGLSKQYKDIIDKVTRGIELNRSEITRFASMQKNFYYDLLYNSDMGKMVPNQIKNAEIVLTPNLIKDLELEDINNLMLDPNIGISQLNLISAEKVGSFHIATITDKHGKLLDLDIVKSELFKAKREYRYENLRMQQELTDALYEEEITLGRQIVKKMIENIPNDMEYTLGGEVLTGEDIKDLYFYLATENIYQDRDSVLLEFDTSLDENGNLKNTPSIDKVIEVLEKMALDLSLTKNMMFGIQKGDNELPRIPLFFGAYNTKIQNILTSIFTNNINNQTFPGLHAPQMSSLFMNKKKGVRQKELQSEKGIQWHKDKGLDTKLKSTIIQDTDEFEVIAAEVLLGRWAKEFYTEDGVVSINDLPEDVRTMIGYRIPTEGKFSIYRFKVVGFLPDDGPAIVLPDEFVTQTGSDFDWDTVFALRYNLEKVEVSDKNLTGEQYVLGDKAYEVRTIKYISGNTANDFNERVETVMTDRKQLVHILSKKYKSQELLDILNRLNTLRSETETISDLNKTRYKDQIERINVLDGIIKSSKGKNREALDEKYELQALVYGDSRSIPYKQKSEYLAIKKDVSQILSKLSINQQNTKKARQNRILDVYSAILTNKVHYPEIIDISNFKDITRVGQEVDELIKNPILNINNFTFEGQQKYRDLANQGRNLKGISVALDRFNSIANVIEIELNNNLDDDFGLGRINTLPKVRYRVNNSELKRLEKDYKGDIEIEKIDKTDESYVTIVHKYVANNSAGTFTGVHGDLITSYSAQTTANIVDNVAHKLPNNVGKYMIDVWKLLPSIGSTFEISTKFINQPILRELVDYYEQISGTVSGGREIEDTKRKYQTLLYRLQLLNGGERNEYYDRAIERNRSITISGGEWFRNQQYKKLGYENNTRIVLSEEELNSNIDFSNSEKILEELNKETVDPIIAKQLEDFIRYQLQILETYKIYRTYAKAISNVGMILNTDKIGAGPTFETTTELLYNIEKAHESKVLSIKGESIMPKVFPKLFGLNTESVYPTLEAFLEASNLLSFKMFSSYFTEYSPLYMTIKRRIHEYINKTTYDKKLSKSINEYLDNSLLKDLPWFNTLTVEDKQRLLGIGLDPILKINLKEEGALQVFESLSVANQIRIYTDNYGRNNSYLNALSIQLQAKNIKKNEFHKIEYNNTGSLDEHTETFNNLWYSDNIFERVIARNLIRYEYLVNGFKFGFGNFTKVIPNNVLHYGNEPFIEEIDNEKGIGLSTHLYGKLDKLNNLTIPTNIGNEKLDEFSLQVFNSNYKERYLRSHWENNSLIPDAGWWRDKSGLRVIQPFGNPDGIISLPAVTLQNAPTSTAMDRLKTREIIKLRYGDKWQLYRRVDSFVNFEDRNVSGTYYYYPIGKLEYYENEEQSIFPSNNLLPNGNEIQSPDDYIGLIKILNEKNKVNDLIFPTPIAMNFNRTHGAFRDGLEQYNTTLELVRAGERTATTRHADTHEAEKWATLKVGQYINLIGTDEYIKVTKTLTHIDLSTLSARQKWSEKEGLDITVAHKLQKDKDLYQFEYIYIGNKQAVIDDSKREYVAEEVEENKPIENDQLSFKFSSYSSSVSPEINNAITTANDFVKTTYGNLTVRAKIYDYSKSTRETVEALDALDITEELTSLHLADLSTALIHILNYMRIELLTPKSDKKTGIIARLSEYENENMYELVNDPIKRRDFINTMSYTLSFLQGIIAFDKLESTGNTNLTKDEQLVNEQIKELQNLLPLIKNTRSKFDRLLKYFSEVNLKKYTSNPEILDSTRNIMDPGDDESYIQLQLDALADTNNPFIANMVKQYSINMIKADDTSTVDVGELEALLRKTFNKNITSLTAYDFRRYLEYKNGRPTGKLIQKYDWDKFYADKNDYFEQIKKQYGKGSDEYRSKVKEWYKNNEITVTTEEEIDEIIAQKERDLSKSAFYKWKRSNLRVENNKRAVKIGTSHLATPINKYINPEWSRIKDDPLYQKFIEIIDRYTDHFGKETILTRGFIPTMTPEAKRLVNPKEIWEKWISENKAHRESESFVGENNEMVYILTVPMVNYFTQEKEIKISNKREEETDNEHIIRVLEETRKAGRGDFKSIYEILAENRKIRKENDDYHAGKIDYNLGNVFSKFIREANRYKAKAQMKREFDLALYQIRHADFYSRDSKGKLIKNKVVSDTLKESTYKYEPGENTNLAKHYAQWLEAIFYGNFDIDEGTWTVISKMLLKFTSAKAMWLNLTAGINNVAFGKLQVRLEAAAKWYFTNKDLNKADAMFISALPDIIMNLGSTKANNLTNAIIKRLDVTQNTNERDYTTGMLKQKFLSSSTLYIFNDMGEHYMQSVSALAMTNHARIINGKIVSFADYKFDNYKKALYGILNDKEKEALDRYIEERYNTEEFKESKKDYLRDYLLALPINKSNAFIEAKKKLDATSEEEFDRYPRLIDAFYLDDNGYAQLQDEIEIDGKKINTNLDKDEFAKFRVKALKVVQKEQGIYNKEDAGMMQRRGLGKLIIQFRKYMRPGWNKRFGTKFGKSFWTESRDEWDKGMYVSMFNFLKTGVKRNYDLNESKEFHGMMGKILNDMYHFATNLGVYWNTLDDFEKGNIRRVMLEQLYLVATVLVATMLKGLKPEDDDDENFAYDLTVYEIDRLYSNAMMYNPIGFINEGRKILKSPAAAQGTLIDTYKLLSNLVGYPFQTPEERVYQTGVYAKENKIMVNATKLIPVLNKYQQIKRINKLNKYYILFRG